MLISLVAFLFSFMVVQDSVDDSVAVTFDVQIHQPGSPAIDGQTHNISTTLPVFRFEQIDDVLRYSLTIADITHAPDSLTKDIQLYNQKLLDLMPDYIVKDTTFYGYVYDYPTRGVPLLKTGHNYWYQVRTVTRDEQELETHHYSQIYQFKVSGTYEVPNRLQQNELKALLAQFVTEADLDGDTIDDVLILEGRDGELRLQGQELVTFLEEFLKMKESGEITVIQSR